ncbi:MAG: sulfatase-like hydrolase/transferase, partial [Prosthecobacter sp.]
MLALPLQAATKPNFVWIIADDMSPDIGAYGLKQVHTPNLDRLAAEGRRYTRAYATAPVCS